jgi:hypothetical protein
VTVARIVVAGVLPLALALAAAAPEPATGVPADHVFALTGTWSCGASDGSTIRRVGTRNGDVVDVADEVRTKSGEALTAHDRYTFQPASGAWTVELDAGLPRAVTGTAPRWLDRSWNALGRDAQGTLQRIRFTWLGESEFVRSVQVEETPGSSRWQTRASEGCARGEAVPFWAPAGCAVPNVTAHAVKLATVDVRRIPPQTPNGTVKVIVHLDEQSRVTSARIQSSPSANLNSLALDVARASQFQTEVRACKPIAADYMFTVTIGP